VRIKMSASTKNLLSLSETILAQTQPVKEVASVGADPLVDDGIKAVVVPDSFVENVLNFSERLNEGDTSEHQDIPVVSEEPTEEPLVESVTEERLTEGKIVSLVERLKSLIIEARDVIQEMTSVGTSTGMIAPGPQKKLMMLRKPSKSKGKKKG
jgi:hypothetical protein|tara:strand:- start:103 stop:564 length:462 start_codon:yes stop_codon:yes gene_type:complete